MQLSLLTRLARRVDETRHSAPSSVPGAWRDSATSQLDAIAAAYVGGVSAAGGVGKVTGSLIGALVMGSLISGMNLMGVGIAYQYIVRGAVLVAAVIFDVATRNPSK